jgi:hypothetical protein
MKTMMVLICWVYTLSIAAMLPFIGCVTNETEYRNMPIEASRMVTKTTMTNAQTLTSISSELRRLLGLYPMVAITSSPVRV